MVRAGHFPAGLFRRLLGIEVDDSRATAPTYPLLTADALEGITSPYALHDELVRRMDGVGA